MWDALPLNLENLFTGATGTGALGGNDGPSWTHIPSTHVRPDVYDASRRELASLFEVIDDPALAAAENMVTEEQFEAIVRQYHEIGAGRTDLRIDTSGLPAKEAAAYRELAMDDLASILQTAGGRELIEALAYQEDDHTTTIQRSRDGEAVATVDGADDTNLRFRRPDGSAGAGVDTRVHYDAGVETRPERISLADEWFPIRSDVTLYHELVHARDNAYGTMVDGTVQAGDGADGWDVNHVPRLEHRAAGLGLFAGEDVSENAYRAARRKIGAAGVGVRPGDVGMAHRDTYRPHPN